MAKIYAAGGRPNVTPEDEFEVYLETAGNSVNVVMRDVHRGGIQIIASINYRGITRPHVYLESMVRFFGGGDAPDLKVPDVDEHVDYVKYLENEVERLRKLYCEEREKREDY